MSSTPAQYGWNEIGPRIREVRKSRLPNINQAEFAKRLAKRGFEIDRTGITRIERGQRFLRDYEIRIIAEVLGVEIAFLFKRG